MQHLASALRSLSKRIRTGFTRRPKELPPVAAYNLWALTYDDQPANLLLHLESELFTSLLAETDLRNKIAVDIGCGTGRHWPQILQQHPAELIGYDASAEMLKQLRQKHPQATARLLEGHTLKALADASCEVVFSTLVIAHLEAPRAAFTEWNRVLKSGGEIILTDYHPAALSHGADRTFQHHQQVVAIKNYVHPVADLRALAGQLGWVELTFVERKIDDTVKAWYEQQQALAVYERFFNIPIVYGWRLKKP